MLRSLARLVALLFVLLPGSVAQAAAAPASVAADSWPPGTEFVPFENHNGLIVIHATLQSPAGYAVSGSLVFDTGAPDLAVVRSVWTALRLDTLDLGSRMAYLRRPLDMLELSRTRLPGVSITGVIPDDVLEQPMIGLFGPNLLGERAIVIDYDQRRLAIVNRSLTLMHYDSTRGGSDRVRRSRARFGAVLTPDAISVPFRLFRGGRMLVEARIEDPEHGWRSLPLTLLLDTGASACALFEDAIRERAPRVSSFPHEGGHVIHTVLGDSPADFVSLPRLRLTAASADAAPEDIEAFEHAREALPDIQGELPDPVHGLLGATFLRRYRVMIDYADLTLWLLPRSNASRVAAVDTAPSGGGAGPGLLLRRTGGEWRVTGWRTGSAAAGSGIAIDDRVVSIDGRRIGTLEDGAEALLAGTEGTQVMVVVQRGGMEQVFRMQRRRSAGATRGR